MTDRFLYAYCIVRRTPGEEVTAVYPDLVCIEAGGVRVVARYVSPDDYSEENLKLRLSDAAWLDSSAREHLAVIVAVMHSHPVIPFNFGTIFKTEESLAGFLETHGRKLEAMLDGLEHREEWAVKAYCDESVLYKNLHRSSSVIAAIEKEIAEASPGRAYLLRKKKEELSVRELETVHAEHARAIAGELTPLSVRHLFNMLASADVTGAEARMLLNGAFLVEADRVGSFLKATEHLAEQYRESGVTLDVTGPWPPYDFVDIPT